MAKPIIPIFRIITLSLSLFFTFILLGLSAHLLSSSLASGGGSGNSDTDDTLDQFDIPHRRALGKRLVGDGGSQDYEGLGIATGILSLLAFGTLYVPLSPFLSVSTILTRTIESEWGYSEEDLSYLGISSNWVFSVRPSLLLPFPLVLKQTIRRIHDVIMDRRIRTGSIRLSPKLPRRMFFTQYEPYVLFPLSLISSCINSLTTMGYVCRSVASVL